MPGHALPDLRWVARTVEGLVRIEERESAH
ncbi:hypothetical protein Wenmar_01643 [Wenxinia marina DSM 24838]|uniref:Uncharacterized protein n=1 Tax=Wenxinia marina DSM 24838 TaxID=1123501 RepID=A0A0D0QGC2_9RHOB|nr:hypothetical protein Wenmar_01643 [Wenxinia marina DSM 24838]